MSGCGRVDTLYDVTSEHVQAGVEALLRRFEMEPQHVLHVRDLSLQLFDGFAGWHGLGHDDRLVLEAASSLHDIGWSVCEPTGRGHHKESARLIREYGWPGLSRLEVEWIALTARYHRKAIPSGEHEDFAALAASDQHRVKVLAALLRVGDALDRTHNQWVTSVHVSLATAGAEVWVTARNEVAKELEAAVRKGDLLAECFPGPLSYRRMS